MFFPSAERIYFYRNPLICTGSKIERFFRYKKEKNHEAYISASSREPGQMCFPQVLSKNSMPGETFLLALAHITPLCHCHFCIDWWRVSAITLSDHWQHSVHQNIHPVFLAEMLQPLQS